MDLQITKMTISKIVCLVFSVVGVSAQSVNPSLPGNSRGAVEKVSSIIHEVSSSSRSGSGAGVSADKTQGGEKAVLQQLIARGKDVLIEDVLDDRKQAAAGAHAYIAARTQTLKQAYIGGCARVFETCPIGWIDSGSTCVNNGEGFCGTLEKSWSNATKESFAWRCRASFPCVSSCKRSFDACPMGWKKGASGSCIAPSSYAGICSPSTNFGGFNNEAKAQWSSLCEADFPCQ